MIFSIGLTTDIGGSLRSFSSSHIQLHTCRIFAKDY